MEIGENYVLGFDERLVWLENMLRTGKRKIRVLWTRIWFILKRGYAYIFYKELTPYKN